MRIDGGGYGCLAILVRESLGLGYRDRMNHQTTIIKYIDGTPLEVDSDIVDLIKLCWDKGLVTMGCCRGYLEGESVPESVQDNPSNRMGYIYFTQSSADQLIKALGPQRRVGPEILTVMLATGEWAECHEDEIGKIRCLDNFPGWELRYKPEMNLFGEMQSARVALRFPASERAAVERVVSLLK